MKFVFLINFQMVYELNSFHFRKWLCRSSGHLELSVHDFCIRIMPFPTTRREICCYLEYFASLRQHDPIQTDGFDC